MLLISFIYSLLNFFYDPTFELVKNIQLIYDPPRKEYVVFIDYSKPISEERLYVYDMRKEKVIMKSKVSHAFKSGKSYAKFFSNEVGTKKSCIGAFLTQESYYGQWGYSMRIQGLDVGINTNARKRAIVFHSNVVQKTSWSEGCFATPHDFNKKLIDLVKGGCLIYVSD